MKSIKRNIASLDIRKGAERCCLTSYKQIGGGISPRSKSRLLNPFTFLLVLALAWAHGAWAEDQHLPNSVITDLTGISENTKVSFNSTTNQIIVEKNNVSVTNDCISIYGDSKSVPLQDNYLKLGYLIYIKFTLKEQATLHIDYKDGSHVSITGENGGVASFTDGKDITNDVALRAGTYTITRGSDATTNINFFTLTTDPAPEDFTTNITMGAVLEPGNAKIHGSYCRFKNGLLDNFANNEYAEFKVSNTKEQYFKFSFKASTNLDGSALEIIYLKSDGTEITRSGVIEVYNNGSWTSFTNEYSHTSDVKIPTDLAKIRLVFYGSGYTVNVRDLTLTPKLDPSPDADAPIRILSVGRDAAPGTFSYNSIDAAIAAVYEGERAIIYLGSGTFNNINIGNRTGTNNKYISIVGEDKATTVFSSDKHRGGDTSDENYVTNTNGGEKAYQKCAALNVYAPRFYGENFTVKNTSGSAGGQAEALNTEGDGFVFNNIQAKGYQDTYLSKSGRRGYFTNSKFVGAIDFVWGGGTVWFEGSEFNCLSGGTYIFAPEDAKGSEIMTSSDYPQLTSFSTLYTSFFANNCNITAESGVGNSSYYLGRAYKGTSGAAVMNSTVDAHIKAQLWSDNGKSDLTYLDYGNTYKNAPNRPSWAKEATTEEYNAYLNPQFLFKNMGTTTFDHEAMLNSVHDPSNIVATPSGSNITITWDCPGAAGYILYKNGVYDQILTDASFPRAANDYSYYAVKALSQYGVSTQAISLGGGTVFEYEMTATQGTQPECDITAKQNNNSLVWYANTVYNGGEDAKVDGKDRYYMKSGSRAFTLTGSFKKDDVLILKVYNYDKQSRGIKVKEGSVVSEEIGIPTAPTTQQLYEITYTIKNDCNTIEVLRVNDYTNTSGLYINHIKVSRSDILTVVSDKTYREIEMGRLELSDGGYQMPYVKGIDNEGNVYNGTAKFTIANEGVAKIQNNKIVPVALGETTMTVTYENSGYETVIPCNITIKVVRSCIKTIIAKKAGEENFDVTKENDDVIHEKDGCFKVNGNLESNIFYDGYTLDLTLWNPYGEGSEVFYRYHIHDNASDVMNYTEGKGTLTGNQTKVLTGLNNSFVIYTEHRNATTHEVLWTSTYEFVCKDDLMYYVAETGNAGTGFKLTIKDNGNVDYDDADNDTKASEFSVRGLKMTYGGTYNGLFGQGSVGSKKETWTYQSAGNNDNDKYLGSDGVLTYKGYTLSSWEIPFTEDPDQRPDHRFSMNGITWDSNIYNNGHGHLSKATNSTGTFALPVIGGYLKFEAEQNGTVILHIFQPGNAYLIGSGSDIVKGMENRPFYFVDEAGRSLKLKSYRTTSYINFDEYNERAVFYKDNGMDKKSNDDEYKRRAYNAFMFKMGYAKPSETRPTLKGYDPSQLSYKDENGVTQTISVGDGQVVPTAQGRLIPQQVMVLHSAAPGTAGTHEAIDSSLPAYISDRLGGEYPEDLMHYIDYGASGSFNHADMKDGTGYMLITDGFIKYAFDVKAGKTYFPYIKGAKFGMCGYEFIPNQTVIDAASLSDVADDPNSTFHCNNLKADRSITIGDNYDNIVALSGVTLGEQYDVTLERTFVANQWTPIVLPFSVSQTKLRKLFGKGTEVLHFDNITKNGTDFTLHLRKHYYDMIVAGTPVYIRPTFKDESNNDISERSTFTFNNVTIEYKDDEELDKVANYWDTEQIGEMKSSLNADEIGYMGIYLSGNKFYQNRLSNNQTIDIKPLRGWIKTTKTVASSAKMSNYLGEEFDFENETQGIDFIEIEDGASRTTYSNDNVYDLNGRLVGSSFTNLDSLPNGIYIVNGKKYTVENK